MIIPAKGSNPLFIDGVYTKGRDTAHPLYISEPRMSECVGVFGSPMVGTFNVIVNRKDLSSALAKIRPSKIGYWTSRGRHVPMKFYLVRLLGKKGITCMAWAISWKAVSRFNGKNVDLELLSKSPIPDNFKSGGIRVEFCTQMAMSEIPDFVGQYNKWFQSFPWSPQRADSQYLWDLMYKHVEWSGSRVLDIGCNTGWFAFEASKYGASVDAYDINEKTINVAAQIGMHINQEDVNFSTSDSGGKYDTIFYLSVHHQVDAKYLDLCNTIRKLKKRCKTLFVELITPPPRYSMVTADIDRLVGGEVLGTYQHNVRCMRRLYIIGRSTTT